MTRRLVWSLVLLAVIVVAGGVWFFDNFEQVPVKKREDAEKEARRNPYLALEHLLARLGQPVSRADKVQTLDAPTPGSVIFLDRSRNHLMSPERLDRLMRWVEAGGHLVIVAEDRRRPDPLLDRLGITRLEAPLPKGRAPWPGANGSIELPGLEHPLKLGSTGLSNLRAGRSPVPELQAGPLGIGHRLLRYRWGRGSITAMTDLDRLLTNHRIGEADHAELFVSLLNQAVTGTVGTNGPEPRRAPLLLVTRLEMPSLWEWLAENAAPAVASFLILLGLWLWHRLPRFGGIAPDLPPARRELREHLAALGRYTWRAGGLALLIEPLRENLRARIALRHPAIAALPPHEQAAALARLTSRAEGLIANALHGTVETPHAFTQAARTLRNLEPLL